MPTKPDGPAQALFREAQAALGAGRVSDAARMLREALALAPDFVAARQHYATLLLHDLGDPAGAIGQIDRLLADNPKNVGYLTFRAAAAGRIGDYAMALDGYAQALTLAPDDAGAWLRYGHTLKTAGRGGEAVAAYRKSLALKPSGEAWWSLADLKTLRFTAADFDAMQRLAQHGALPVAERAALHFALGKALDERGQYAAAFLQYDLGNTLKRTLHRYDADDLSGFAERASALFTPAFFEGCAGSGAPTQGPIFVIGLPRSGSTLVEQILASHSAVEGTMELPDLIAVARRALERGGGEMRAYPDVLARLTHDDLRALGEDYLERTRVYRREGRAFFVDKMPENFVHAGLIALILPGAKIVDVRRHPLSCGWSAFKQNFTLGQAFSYALPDIGRYYADYVRLMAHIDTVLPGRVHRVIYEKLVADPHGETRRLLAACGLPFEESCLHFHENPRAVRTASAEQVRRPIFTDGLESWRPYEAWLGSLKDALGPALAAYPDAPLTAS